MTRLQKNNLYDRICKALTTYEEHGCRDAEELYDILGEVSCYWEEITGEEED